VARPVPHSERPLSARIRWEKNAAVAVKIKLKRMGKIREPYFRIVVADARTKRDGRAIEEIGKYHPKAEPSVIEVNSERAQHWLSVGAQPTDPVRKIFEVTGDWQRFKGLPGAEGTLRTAPPRAGREDVFAAALAETVKTLKESEPASKGRAKPGTAKSGPAKSGDAKAGGAKPEEGKARDAKAGDAKAGDAKAGDAKSGKAKAADAKADKPARAKPSATARPAKTAKAADAVNAAEGEPETQSKAELETESKAEPEIESKAEPETESKAEREPAPQEQAAEAAEPGSEG